MSEQTVRSHRARHRRRAPIFLAIAVLSLGGNAMAAEPSSPNRRAAAEALFDSGLKLMKQGDFAQGCPKLEESQQMDPAVGTLLYLAECYERVGRSASAWATFREAASLARATGQEARARTGLERAERIEPSLAKLTVEVAGENAEIPAFELRRGGDVLPKAVWGVALPVDRGEVVLEARAPGYAPWSAVVVVAADGEKRSVTVPPLDPAPRPLPSSAPASNGADGESNLERDGGLEAPPRTQRTLAVVAGAAGLVGIGVGSYFGVRAMQRNADAADLCAENNVCRSPRAVTLTEQARDAATVSNVAFAAGGALLVGAVVLYVTAPKARSLRVAAALGAGSAGLDLRGDF